MGKLNLNKLRLRNVLTALLFGTLLITIVPSSVFAAAAIKKPTPPAVTNNTNSLKVSPLRSEITIKAGESSVVKTYVTNITKAPIAIHPIENDFVAGDERGTPSIILDENSYAPSHSLKRFMVPLKDVVIQPNESKEIAVSITVPKSAQAGGYYGAVRFAPVDASGNKNVNLSASAASLILLTVPGPVNEDLRLTNFDLRQNGEKVGYVRTPDGIDVLLRFENKGNIQQAPIGQIVVTDTKTKKVIYTHDFNKEIPRDNILPDSARRWEIPLKNFGKFGKYNIDATFSYGSQNKTIEIKRTMWVIPTTYLIAAGAALIGLIFLVIFVVVGLKAYKKKILKSSYRRRR